MEDRKDLENGINRDIFNGLIDPPEKGITINDVDDYSLNEMIKMHNNLMRIRWKKKNN